MTNVDDAFFVTERRCAVRERTLSQAPASLGCSAAVFFSPLAAVFYSALWLQLVIRLFWLSVLRRFGFSVVYSAIWLRLVFRLFGWRYLTYS
ncbi:MAG: hypothetical protein ABJB74_04180 [Gemmatimonas sp.]